MKALFTAALLAMALASCKSTKKCDAYSGTPKTLSHESR